MVNSTQSLLRLLTADDQVYYQKLRAYHWTVTGPLFFGLHEQPELLYTDAALKVDELAERLLAMGGMPPATLSEALGSARLTEAELPTSGEGDTTTVNLVDSFRDQHQKTAWMLHAFSGGGVAV